MKATKQTFTTTLIVLFTATSYAQKTMKDSLLVNIKDKIELRMSIYDHSNLSDDATKDLNELRNIFLKSNNEIPQNSPYNIVYNSGKKITIENAEESKTIIWENGKHMPYKFKNSCLILSDKYQMNIYFNELEDLISMDLVNKVNESIEAMQKDESRYSKLFNYSFDKDSLIESKDFGIGSRAHSIEIKAGVGANLIKNQLMIDLSGEIGLNLNRKDVSKSNYYVSYNILYDFIENSSADLNGFLNLGYRYNFSDNNDKSNWVGLEFGYLVNQEGDMFDDNTFRFGVNWNLGNSISVSPQLYISSEQTFPGLRIGFGF
jgi:hypothetical protein